MQEEKRRALARDLHDGFGQCLTAAGALATTIEFGAAADRPHLAGDARSIARLVKRMMTTVREALARLRSQDVDELGLEASLAQLVGGWNAQAAPRAVFHLAVGGEQTSSRHQLEQCHASRRRQLDNCMTSAPAGVGPID